MFQYGMITCKRCGKVWYGQLCGRLYCSDCRKIINSEKTKKYQKEKAEKEAKKHPDSIEIARLADAEGLSYGKYCLKYGI